MVLGNLADDKFDDLTADFVTEMAIGTLPIVCTLKGFPDLAESQFCLMAPDPEVYDYKENDDKAIIMFTRCFQRLNDDSKDVLEKVLSKKVGGGWYNVIFPFKLTGNKTFSLTITTFPSIYHYVVGLCGVDGYGVGSLYMETRTPVFGKFKLPIKFTKGGDETHGVLQVIADGMKVAANTGIPKLDIMTENGQYEMDTDMIDKYLNCCINRKEMHLIN